MQCDFRQQHVDFGRLLFASATVFALVVGGSPAMADDFQLRCGKTVRGAVVSETESEFMIKTEMGTIKVPKSDVVQITGGGTTTAEIDGDIAVSRKDFQAAITLYKQAAAQAGSESAATERLNEKIARISSATQQIASGNLTLQFAQATELLRTRNYDAAETLLSKLASQLAPQDPMTSSVHQLQAQLYHGKGMAATDAIKLEVAKREFENAIVADSSYYPAYLALGKALLANSATTNRGIDMIEEGLRIAGDQLSEQDRFSNEYLLGTKYFELGNYPKAAVNFASVIPARSRYTAYSDALDKAVESYVRMGEENLTSDFKETIANLNEALLLNPSNQKALFLLGRIYLDNGQIENAIITLSKLLELAPKYPEANHYLGTAYFKSRDYKQALVHLSLEIQNDANNYLTLVDRAEVYIASGDYTSAQTDLATAKAIKPENWYAYYLTGLESFRQMKYPEARASLMEALERSRRALPVHLLMGRVLLKQNEPVAARQWFEGVVTGLENISDLSYQYKLYNAEALGNLALISVDEKSPRQALNYATKAMENAPDYGLAIVSMAAVKLLLADDPTTMQKDALYKEAEDLFVRAIASDPENPEYYLKLAEYYRKYQRNSEKARANYNLYVDKGGKDPQVNSWLIEVGGTARTELNAPVATPSTTFASTTSPANTGTTNPMMMIPTTGTLTTTTSGTLAPVMPMEAVVPGVPVVPMTQTLPASPESTPTAEAM